MQNNDKAKIIYICYCGSYNKIISYFQRLIIDWLYP
jgi:hypothetical protein